MKYCEACKYEIIKSERRRERFRFAIIEFSRVDMKKEGKYSRIIGVLIVIEMLTPIQLVCMSVCLCVCM